MADLSTTAPDLDEVEVSLFGPGYGESVVVHLGDGAWLINDSCLDRTTRRPAALQYLSGLGVEVSRQVVLVIASHWHDDHVRGLAEVYAACGAATFVCASSLRSQEFLALASRELDDGSRLGSGLREMQQVITEVLARRGGDGRADSRERPVLRFAGQDMTLYAAEVGGRPVTVHALSPSSVAALRSMNDLSRLLLDDSERRLRVPALEPNDASVVLWVEASGASFLLGADLETTADPADGWDSILGSTTRPPGRASLYKVAHHGSVTGHHDRLFEELLGTDVVSVLTPWRRGRASLPTDSDRTRLCASSGSAYSTVVTASPRHRRDPAVVRTLREMGAKIREVDPQIGHIQLRRRPGEDAWRIGLAPPSGSLCG